MSEKRRWFLGGIWAGLATLLAACATTSQVLPSSPSVSPSPSVIAEANRALSEQVASGRIVVIYPHALQLETETGPLTVTWDVHLRVWEGSFVGEVPWEVGDRIIAWGARDGERVFRAEKIWVNPVNLMGPIEAVTPEERGGWRVRMRDRYLGVVEVRVDPRTVVGKGEGMVGPLEERSVALVVGRRVQVVGRRLKDGTILAASLDVWEP